MIEYGMFTPEGNTKVHHIVANSQTFAEADNALTKLAENESEQFGEADDTDVRETVYQEMLMKEAWVESENQKEAKPVATKTTLILNQSAFEQESKWYDICDSLGITPKTKHDFYTESIKIVVSSAHDND